MLSINTNVPSLTAQRNLMGSSKAMAKSLERLSSGLRINRAADDAAGLAISTALTSQINGMNQAARNANDGISLLNTAEGAIVEQTTILQRMRTLAVQAANDTNSSENRAQLQNEISQLRDELTRISDTVNFNGRNLLNGSFKDMQLQVGANANQTMDISISDLRASSLGGSVQGAHVTATGKAAATEDDLYINGFKIETTPDYTSATGNDFSAKAYVDAINSADAGVTATANKLTIMANQGAGSDGLESLATSDDITLSTTDLKINGIRILDDELVISSDNATWSQLTGAINAKSDQTGVTASIETMNGNSYLALSNTNGENIDLTGATADLADLGFANTAAFHDDGTADYNYVGSYTISSNTDIVISGTNEADAGFVARADDVITLEGTNAVATDDLSLVLAEGDFVINGVSIIGSFTAATSDVVEETMAGLINAFTAETGVQATVANAGKITLTSYDPEMTLDGNDLSTFGFTAVVKTALGGIIEAEDAGTLTIADLSVATAEDANKAIVAIDAAIQTISTNRSEIGAMTNRLESTISNLRTVSENLSASRSQILDTDFASETATLTKNQILQQAGVAILAQANLMSQSALSLLG